MRPRRKKTAAIVAAPDDGTPLRLPLGNDAADGILAHLGSVETEIRTWEKLSRSTDLVASTQ